MRQYRTGGSRYRGGEAIKRRALLQSDARIRNYHFPTQAAFRIAAKRSVHLESHRRANANADLRMRASAAIFFATA